MSIAKGQQTGGLALEPGELEAWIERDQHLQVLDVRESYEHETGHIDGARHVPLVALPSIVQTLDRERPVVFYCRSGVRSEMAAEAMTGAGFEAYSMRGGLLRWASEGRPLAPRDGAVADH